MDSSNMPAPVEGQLIHVEIYCDDIARGKTFYGNCFNWTFREWGDSSSYLLFMDASGKLGGGLTTHMQNTGAGGVLLYIYTGDINAKLAQVEEHGGRTLEGRTEIPGVGFYAAFVDPFGNHMGLFGK